MITDISGGNEVENCFVCGKPTIGIAGIEATLDTFMVNEGKEGDLVLESESYGTCHMSCLAHHRSGPAWAVLLRRHFEKNMGYLVGETLGSVVVLHGGRPESYLLLRNDGGHIGLTPSEFDDYKNLSVRELKVCRRSVQRIGLDVSHEFNAWFAEKIERGEQVDLGLLYSKLEIPSFDDEWKFHGTLVRRIGSKFENSPTTGCDGTFEIEVTFSIPLSQD